MTCHEIDDLIEALAAGEAVMTPDVSAHVAGCARCAASLACARRIDAELAAAEPLAPPETFGAAVMARIRRERWRSEQRIDRFFNLAIAAAAVLVVAGIWMLFNLSGMAEIGRDTARLMAEGVRVAGDRMARQLPAYAGASGLLLSAIGVWWWAERT